MRPARLHPDAVRFMAYLRQYTNDRGALANLRGALSGYVRLLNILGTAWSADWRKRRFLAQPWSLIPVTWCS